jgi:hypothetical protein
MASDVTQAHVVGSTEADIRMMAFNFREFTKLLNKSKRLPEIAKPETPLDAVSFLRQLPVGSLCVKKLSLLASECGHSPATGKRHTTGTDVGVVNVHLETLPRGGHSDSGATLQFPIGPFSFFESISVATNSVKTAETPVPPNSRIETVTSLQREYAD